MSTASGVVFAGDHEGAFNAFDSKSGKRLWSYAPARQSGARRR
jgi:hypothetical protein